jgi:DNA-binding MarR family transcriptional regulator
MEPDSRHTGGGFGADHGCVPRDSVDRLIADWNRARPELDFAPVGIVARLARARAHIDAALEAVFERHGLTAPTFAVLVTLARLDRPAGVPQRTLMDELGLSSGTISVRMDRLEEEGLVERRPDAGDRRNTLIVLTEQGRLLFERVVPAHLENERRVLVALDDDEQLVLAALLRKLLVEYEGTLPQAGADVRLGVTLSPAHVTIAMRGAVGLPARAGLLVRAVADTSPARDLLRPGDVLERAGSHALTSVAGLYAAIADAVPAGHLDVRVLRGLDSLDVRVPLADAASAPPLAAAATAGRARRDLHFV